MQARFAALGMFLMGVIPSALWAGGKAQNQASVTFHIETEASDNPKMIFAQAVNGQTRYFRRMPEISIKDLLSFNPCPSDAGGDDYGVVFKLKDNAVKRFAAITNLNQGRWLIAQVNGRVLDGVLIDRQIDDGFVVVWKGVALADINVLGAALPRIGQEGQKKKKKKK